MSVPPYSALADLREAIQKKVDKASQNTVADAIGVASNTVGHFLRGGPPRKSTVKKYRDYLAANPETRVRSRQQALVEGAYLDRGLALLTSYTDASAGKTERALRIREVMQGIPKE